MCEPISATTAATAAAASASTAAAATAATAAASTVGSFGGMVSTALAGADVAATSGSFMSSIMSGLATAWESAGWGTALSIGTSGFNYMADRANRKAMLEAARQSEGGLYAGLQAQQAQNNMQASDKMSNVALESLRAMGQLRAAAGDTGLGGLNADRIGGEIRMAEGMDIATLESNRRMANNQYSAEAASMVANNYSRLAAVKRPSLIGAGLQIVGGNLDDQRRAQLNKLGYRGVGA